MPEGKVPATAGQMFVVLSPENFRTQNPHEHVHKDVINFEIAVVHRIRDVPNDRFGKIYLDDDEMADIHQAIKDEIVSFAMFQRLLVWNALEKIGNSQVADPELDAAARPVKYSVIGEFTHHVTRLDPVHLWPNYFLAKTKNPDRKIAGYKTVSTFTSPTFIQNRNLLDCLPLFAAEE